MVVNPDFFGRNESFSNYKDAQTAHASAKVNAVSSEKSFLDPLSNNKEGKWTLPWVMPHPFKKISWKSAQFLRNTEN